MASETITLSYDKIVQSNKKYTTIRFSDTEEIKMVNQYLDDIDRRGRTVCMPLWYAEKVKLIERSVNKSL